MNVRIDEKGVRFRITPADLAVLLAGGEIRRRVGLAAGGFEYGIVPALSGEDMSLEAGGQGLTLSVPYRVLEQLRDMGRSKDGMSAKAGDTEVSLQVDIKVPTHKAA